MKKFFTYLIFLWVFLMLQADLKVTINPYIDWIFTLLLLIPVFICNINSIKIDTNKYSFILMPSFLLVISFLISGFSSTEQVKNIFQCFKLILLFFLILPLLNSNEKYKEVAFNAFLLSSLINFILLLIGKYFLKSIAWQAAYLRYGTVFNLPGSLYKPGIFVLPYLLYSLLRKYSFRNLILLISSVGLIFFDGSRSGFIGFLIALLYMTVIYVYENIKSKRIKFKKINNLIILGCILVIGSIIVINFNLIPGFNRIGIFINKIKDFGIINGLAQADPIRYQMLQKSIIQINNNPIMGQGFGMTRVNGVVIHNTYLQVWSDLGILGFISLIFLYFSWMLMLPKTLANLKHIKDVKTKALYYNCIFSLFFYDLLGLFHPLSVEPSEWITFFVPFVIYSNYYRREIYDEFTKTISECDNSYV